MSENFDLFGMPIPDGHGKRGRPVHVATDESTNKVKLLLALGWSNERIAHAIGLSLPTLRKHYFQVLKVREFQRDMMDAARLMKLWELAMAGNVAAAREFDRMLERNDAMNADKAWRGDDPEVAAPKEKLGKKELAQRAAEAVEDSSAWGHDLVFRGKVN